MAAQLLAVLVALASVPTSVAEDVLSELDMQDDVCPNGAEDCVLSLRQLRGEVKRAEVASHDHARASTGAWQAGQRASSPKADAQSRQTAKEAAKQTANDTSHLTSEEAKEAVEYAEQVVKDSTSLHGENNATAKAAQGSRVTRQHDGTAQPTAGACTADDQAALTKAGSGNADGTFPKLSSNCGHKAYWWFGFHQSYMSSCIASAVGISSGCADCFAAAGQYGYDNCKWQCLFGSWCSHSCLGCTAPNNDAVKACAGVEVPNATFC